MVGTLTLDGEKVPNMKGVQMSLEVSVVIATYNKKEYLELTLASLANQTYPHTNFEVVVVDDGSKDGTSEIFSASTVFPFQAIYIKQENKGRAAARNAGILNANGNTIVFIDDDQIVAPQYLENHMGLHQQNQCLVVGGYRSDVFSFCPSALEPRAILYHLQGADDDAENQSCVDPGSPLITVEDIYSDFDCVKRLSYGLDMNFERVSGTYGEDLDSFFIPWIFFVTCNVSVRKIHLIEVGMFDENFTGWGIEDYELGYALYKHGLEYKLCRDAVSYHQFHARDFDRAGESELRNYRYFCQKHPDLAIFLYWRKTYEGLSIHAYNDIVGEACYLEKNAQSRQLLTDYKALLKEHLETHGLDLAERQQYWQLPSLAEKALLEEAYESARSFALKYINLNAHRADEQQRTLKECPSPAVYGSYSHLNNVARCWLVVANAYAAKGETQKVLEARDQILDKYPFAQRWDAEAGFVKLSDVASGLG